MDSRVRVLLHSKFSCEELDVFERILSLMEQTKHNIWLNAKEFDVYERIKFDYHTLKSLMEKHDLEERVEKLEDEWETFLKCYETFHDLKK